MTEEWKTTYAGYLAFFGAIVIAVLAIYLFS